MPDAAAARAAARRQPVGPAGRTSARSGIGNGIGIGGEIGGGIGIGIGIGGGIGNGIGIGIGGGADPRTRENAVAGDGRLYSCRSTSPVIGTNRTGITERSSKPFSVRVITFSSW